MCSSDLHARARRLFLPVDLMDTHRVFTNQIFDLKSSPGLHAVVRTVADAARGQLTAARADRAMVPRAALAAVLMGTLADFHLRTLERAKWDPFAPRVAMRHPLTTLHLGWAAVTGRW